MHNELIDKLSKLNIEKTYLKRELDRYFNNHKERQRIFDRINKIDRDISLIKFKLEMERRNGKNNTCN